MIDAQLPQKVVDVNYFVCTLGQATALIAQKPHLFKTVNEFIDHQARQHPNHPAVGFPVPPEKDKSDKSDKEWRRAVYSKRVL